MDWRQRARRMIAQCSHAICSRSAKDALRQQIGGGHDSISGRKPFDFIVVGAGSAGCVVANRLSRNPKNRVLLVEAGASDWYPWIHIPVGYLYTQGNPITDWCLNTDKQDGLNGRSIMYPRGKVLGGCSSINGMIYMRGQTLDYDNWANKHGCKGWDWKSMEGFFDRSLAISGGEVDVSEQRLNWHLLDIFRESMGEFGIPASSRLVSSDSESVGKYWVTQRFGIRQSAYSAFIRPVLDRPNLTVVNSATVNKIILDDDQLQSSDCAKFARGIELTFGPGTESIPVSCNKEVILCAGAIKSPQILQLSGIGDSQELAKAGINTQVQNGHVGNNLHDHLQLRAIFKLKEGTQSLNSLANSMLGRLRMGIQYALFRTGPLSMAPSQLGAFIKSDSAMLNPNVQFHVQPLSLDRFGQPLHPFPGLTVSVCNLKPTSRGRVAIASSDPHAPPIIDPNYLHTNDDKRVAAQSLRLARKFVMSSNAFKNLCPEQVAPEGISEQDDDACLARAAGDIGTSIYHPVGTCRMGMNSNEGVVDTRLRVFGVRNLRVADASIMPEITSGNTAAPCMAIGERVAHFILQDCNAS